MAVGFHGISPFHWFERGAFLARPVGFSTLLILMALIFNAPASQAHAEKTSPSYGIRDMLRPIEEVLTLIQENYAYDISEEQLIQGAIEGIVRTLDQRSKYLPADSYHNLKLNLKGHFSGIGVEVSEKNRRFFLTNIIKNGPADKQKLAPGDELIRLNNIPLAGLSLEEVVALLEGNVGEKVTVLIARNGRQQPPITLTRDVVALQHNTPILMENIVYIPLHSLFQQHTAHYLKNAILHLKKRLNSPIKGIILDLRNNKGGLLEEGVHVSNLFLEDKDISFIQGQSGHPKKRFRAGKGCILRDVPMVVLINHQTGSAAEVIAGALQDQKRAVILGVPSYGKASVQSIYPLADGQAALRLTTHHYFTPQGRNISLKGIAPDLPLKEKAGNSQEDIFLSTAIEWIHRQDKKDRNAPKAAPFKA